MSDRSRASTQLLFFGLSIILSVTPCFALTNSSGEPGGGGEPTPIISCDMAQATLSQEMSLPQYLNTMDLLVDALILSDSSAAAELSEIEMAMEQNSTSPCARRTVTVCRYIPFCGIVCSNVKMCTGTCSGNLACSATYRPNGTIQRCSCQPANQQPGQPAEGASLDGGYTCATTK